MIARTRNGAVTPSTRNADPMHPLRVAAYAAGIDFVLVLVAFVVLPASWGYCRSLLSGLAAIHACFVTVPTLVSGFGRAEDSFTFDRRRLRRNREPARAPTA